MRKIEPQPRSSRKWRRWKTDCDRATDDLKTSVAQGSRNEVDPKLYGRKSIREEYFFSKDSPFYSKCVYCETLISRTSEGDIEHFRPHGAVSSKSWEPIMIPDAQGQEIPHPGYYWLAYDWKNLVPACQTCNRSGKIGTRRIGKSTRFPVAKTHASQPGDDLAAEEPLLINPASGDPEDDPEKHLMFNTSNAMLDSLTERGGACIDIFGLNVRETLLDGRRKTCRIIRSLLAQLTDPDPTRRSEAVKEIRLIISGKDPNTHAIAARAVMREWKQASNALEGSTTTP